MLSLGLIELVCFWLIGVHEFGHLAVARILKLHGSLGIKHWSIPVARVQVDEAWQNLCVALGGPLMSILVGVALFQAGYLEPAALSIFFGLFSLIPFKHNDGWRIFRFRRGFA